MAISTGTTGTAGTSANNAIGEVIALDGTGGRSPRAWAKDPASEQPRLLEIGSPVYANEIIITGPKAVIAIEFIDGSRFDLGRGSEMALGPDIFDPTRVAAAEPAEPAEASPAGAAPLTDVEAIQQALLAGVDPTAELEATAAGPGAGGGGANEGSSFVILDRSNQSTTPESGYETDPIGVSFNQDVQELLLVPPEGSLQIVIGDISPVNEDDLEDGSDLSKESLSSQGTIEILAEDGVGSLVVGGIPVITGGVFTPISAQIDGADGSTSLSFISYDPTTGIVTYEFTLTDNVGHSEGDGTNTFVQDLGIILTDVDGDSAAAVLTLSVIDDIPTARDDQPGVQDGEGSPIASQDQETVSGNVLDNDTQGADRIPVSETTGPVVPDEITGTYGTLTLNPDGSYDYTVDVEDPDLAALLGGETAVDEFDYTLVDSDGDTSTATLSVTVENTDDPVEIIGLTEADGETSVVPDDLTVDEADQPPFTSPVNKFEISSPDGFASMSIAGQAISLAQLLAASDLNPVVIATELGNDLNIVDYNGDETGGTICYTYSLLEAETHSGQGTSPISESLPVTLADLDGDTDSATIDVGVLDAVPVANPDSADIEEDTAKTIDVFSNDLPGVDGVDLGTGVSKTTDPSKGSLTYNGDGTFTYTPNAGAEGDDQFTYTITDADGDTSTATVNLNIAPDSTPTISVVDAEGDDRIVDEEALFDGSNPGSDDESTSGTFEITTGNDGVGMLEVQDKDGIWQDVTNGGTVAGALGSLVVTGSPTGGYSWTYTLSDNTLTHTGDDLTGPDDQVPDDFSARVTDTDGDQASAPFTILVNDDGPTAISDSTSTAEDTAVTYNVITNSDGTSDVQGADLNATLVAATLASGLGTVSHAANGDVTFTPAAGFEGDAVIDYTIRDADGDDSSAQLTVTVDDDSTPTISVVDAEGDDRIVDEEALFDGSNPGSDDESTSGTFEITTGNDGVGMLEVQDKDGIWQDVTNGGTVAGALGSLVVTGSPTGGYSWTYTLSDNTLTHTGDDLTGPDDQVPDDFSARVTDTDGDQASAPFTILVNDDGPTAISDSTSTAEDTAVTYNVITNSDGTSDVQGADLNATLVAATLASGLGTVSHAANGDVTFTPAAGFEGDAVIDYTIRDADGDDSSAQLTVTVDDDSTPTISVVDAEGDDRIVDEEALFDGSNPGSDDESTSGTFEITTGNDGVGMLEVQDKDGIWQDVTNGGTVAGALGSLVVTGSPTGGYSWTYTLSDNTLTHTGDDLTGPDDQVPDDFSARVTDTDGDQASAPFTILVNDDGPTAISDSTSTAEDTAVTYNVITNSDGTSDVQGADLNATLVAATLASGLGTVSHAANGDVTFTPAAGFEGDAVIDYTIRDADGDDSSAQLTVTVDDDSTPTISVVDAEGDDRIVDEEALFDGSNPGSDDESTSGTFEITTGNDGVGMLEVQDKDGIWQDVTNGGTVAGALGSLVVTGSPTGGYSWTYTLSDNTLTHTGDDLTGPDDQVPDDFSARVTDTDGDQASAPFTILVNDDGPTAISDSTSTAEDTAVTYNVITNSDGTSDVQGADLNATLVAATLASGLGTVSHAANGDVTFTPAAGFEGDAVIDYTIRDADGDDSSAQLTVTVDDDSTPTISVVDAEGDDRIVDEEALFDGSNPGSDDESTSGTFEITTGNDGVGMLEVQDKDGIWQDVTNGGTVAGALGSLVVTGSPTGGYSWTYTLSDNTLTHTGDDLTGPDDQVPDDFSARVTDTDGDQASAPFTILVNDDGPTAISDSTSTAEDTAVTYNVITNSDGTSDVQGADLNATLVAATLASGLGTVSHAANGDVTFTPAAGFEGDAVIDYTIRDADGDDSSAQLTVTVDDDSTPSVGETENLTLDEDGLPGAADDTLTIRTDETDSTESTMDTGTVSVNFGNDVPANPLSAIALLDNVNLDNQLQTLDGQNVIFALAAGALVGSVDLGATEVIRLEITEANAGTTPGEIVYTYKATLSEPLKHEEGLLENTASLTGIEFSVTDSDQDLSGGSFSVSIIDDVPDIALQNAVLTGQASTLTGDLGFLYGADGMFDGADPLMGLTALSGVEPDDITYTSSAGIDGGSYYKQITATSDSDQSTVFTLRVFSDGTYEFDLVTPQIGSITVDGSDFVAPGNNEYEIANLGDEGAGVVLTGEIGGSCNTVNTSQQGMGVGSQAVNGDDVLIATFTDQIHPDLLSDTTVADSNGDSCSGDDARALAAADPLLINSVNVYIRQIKHFDPGDAVRFSLILYSATGVASEVATGTYVPGSEAPITVGSYTDVEQFSVLDYLDSTPTEPLEFHEIRLFVDDVGGSGAAPTYDVLQYEIFSEDLPTDLDLSFDVGIKDGDGDSAAGTLNVHVETDGDLAAGYMLDGNQDANSTSDRILGSAGDDQIEGKSGDDVMTGGDGTDTFIFGSDTNGDADTITDFTIGSSGDVLDLRDVLDYQSSAGDDLTDYLNLQAEGSGTLLNVSSEGTTVTSTILLDGVSSLTLQDLLDDGNLLVE